MAPNNSKNAQQGYNPSRDPKIIGLGFKVASRALLVFESICGKLLLCVAIGSIIYAPSWYPVLVNFIFLVFQIAAMVTYNMCHPRCQPICTLPLLAWETVTIFWVAIWLYAAIQAIITGHLWNLEWLGGPREKRFPYTQDVETDNVVNPDQNDDHTKRAVFYGSGITVASIIVLIIKILGWKIIKTTYTELRRRRLANIKAEKQKKNRADSDLGGESSPYPLVYRAPSPQPPKRKIRKGREDYENGDEVREPFVHIPPPPFLISSSNATRAESSL